MYKDLAINNLKWLICHKTQPTNQLNDLAYLTAYKMHPNFSRQIKKKKQSTNIKRDEIKIMNIINDNF